ncbi:MAG: ATP-binding protein [Bacteriovoracia bacterium]
MHKFTHYQAVLAAIGRNPVIAQGTRSEALRELTREAAKALGVSVVGFWAYDDGRRCAIVEANYSSATGTWSDGAILTQAEAPHYYESLQSERVLAIDDCLTDPLVSELVESYFIPSDIRSMLDTPVLFDGEMAGMICCESIGVTRRWASEDKFFVLMIADFVGRILERERRRALERKISVENLRRGEDQLKALLSALPVSLAMLDREMRFLAISESWHRNFPSTRTEPIGECVWDCSPYFLEEWKERLLRALKGEVVTQAEECVVGHSGDETWICWQLAPWHNISGEIGGVVILCDDITERKNAELKLSQTTKLTAFGEMAGGIAHEINNPLSIVKGFVDLMQKSLKRNQFDPTTFSQYLERSSVTLLRISRIVQSMRRISRDSSLDELSPEVVNTVVTDALDFTHEKFRDHNIAFFFNPGPEGLRVLCRPVEISQVLLNLLTNAFHAVVDAPEKRVEVSVVVGPATVSIRVADSGRGVPPANRQRIFQPFFTTKETGQGTGLGLSISQTIMRGHGGRLYLDEAAPLTTFVVELPLA